MAQALQITTLPVPGSESHGRRRIRTPECTMLSLVPLVPALWLRRNTIITTTVTACTHQMTLLWPLTRQWQMDTVDQPTSTPSLRCLLYMTMILMRDQITATPVMDQLRITSHKLLALRARPADTYQKCHPAIWVVVPSQTSSMSQTHTLRSTTEVMCTAILSHRCIRGTYRLHHEARI